MLDKSIPHIGVLMIKTESKTYPRYDLPQGYRITGYFPGLESGWATLQFSVGQTDSLEEAEEIFQKVFLPLPGLLNTHCLFVLDGNNQVVSTASLWQGEHFGQNLQRIHFVATAPDHQGKGLAKALLTQLLVLFNRLYEQDFIYLTSQTWSYRALHLYSLFGFVPYQGPRPVNWSGTDDEFTRDTARAWELIFEKLK